MFRKYNRTQHYIIVILHVRDRERKKLYNYNFIIYSK